MAIGNFLKNLGKTKVEDAEAGLVKLAVALDSDAVAETAVKQKQDEHDIAVRQLVDAQAAYAREKKEFDEIQAIYDKKMAAAELAQADLEKNPDDKEAAAALEELLGSVEKILPKLEKEKSEAERAKQFLDNVQEAANDIAADLRNLREQIDGVKRAKTEAEIAAAQAKKQREQAETLAGLRRSTNKFNVAMTALQQQADEVNKEAEVNRIAAEQLAKPVEKVSSAASKYLDGVDNSVSSTESLQDRMTRLKAKSGK